MVEDPFLIIFIGLPVGIQDHIVPCGELLSVNGSHHRRYVLKAEVIDSIYIYPELMIFQNGSCVVFCYVRIIGKRFQDFQSIFVSGFIQGQDIRSIVNIADGFHPGRAESSSRTAGVMVLKFLPSRPERLWTLRSIT